MNIRLNLDEAGIKARFTKNGDKAQRWLDNEIVKDSEPYVPYRKGTTTRSVYSTIGSGKLVYNTPYARKIYYGTNMHFNHNTHPKACAQWFEKAKAVNLKKWMDGVKKIAGGGA